MMREVALAVVQKTSMLRKHCLPPCLMPKLGVGVCTDKANALQILAPVTQPVVSQKRSNL